MKKLSEKKRFSIVARAKSIPHGIRGIGVVFKTQHNAWVHIFFGILAIAFGFYFNISTIEWLFIIISILFVITAEAFNTAIEIDIDLTSPTYHPYARDTKDVAAGAVLLSVIVAISVGIIIFLPKVIALF